MSQRQSAMPSSMRISKTEKQYIDRDGKQLALGYTTGSCSAAAAKAAMHMLLSGEEIMSVTLLTPKGITLDLEVLDIRRGEDSVTCGIRKDAGDDPDVTHGMIVYATVSYSDRPGVEIDGGIGVGRVTKPGLDQPVGNAAINSTPRRMIREVIEEQIDTAVQGIRVMISIPGGEEVALQTFNPRLGVVGGLSVLGTSGIVTPMSEQALTDTIRVEINVRLKEGYPILPIAPGNYGKAFFHEKYGFDMDMAIASSNFIAQSIEMAKDAGAKGILFIGHIGKLIKVAGGIRNTHSRYGDHRMEITCDLVREVCGGMKVDSEDEIDALCAEISECVAMDDAVRVLKEAALDEPVMDCMTRHIYQTMNDWAGEHCPIEVIVFSNQYGVLGQSKGAQAYMDVLKKYEHQRSDL